MYSAVWAETSKCPLPVSQRKEIQLSGYFILKARAGFTLASHHSYSPSIISPGIPSIFLVRPHSRFSLPYPQRLVRGASPWSDIMARVLSGFHAAKFHGYVAMAEWPSGTTGTCFSSSYPLTAAKSSIMVSNAFCTPVSTFHCWSSPGVIHIIPTPISESFCLKQSISNKVSSDMLCWPTTTAFIRSAFGGSHRKASGFLPVSDETIPFTVTFHCHSPAKLYAAQRSSIMGNNILFIIFLHSKFLKKNNKIFLSIKDIGNKRNRFWSH